MRSRGYAERSRRRGNVSASTDLSPERRQPAGANVRERLARIAPGAAALIRYNFTDDFPHDLAAGVSVAAVALPVAIAYAELAGFSPVIGLYSSILPLVAY